MEFFKREVKNRRLFKGEELLLDIISGRDLKAQRAAAQESLLCQGEERKTILS